MDITRILARKVILSVDVAFAALYLVLGGVLHQTHFAWAMGATIISFLAAETIQERKYQKRKGNYAASLKDLFIRIKNIFSMKFLAAFFLVNVMHYLLATKRIDSNTWFLLVPIVCSFYNISNAIIKDPGTFSQQ